MILTAKERGLLDALVREVPPQFDTLFAMQALSDEKKGACVTYSRLLAEVLGEFGISATVRSVFIITANRAGIDYRQSIIDEEEARKRGGRIQLWGDITRGQEYLPLFDLPA